MAIQPVGSYFVRNGEVRKTAEFISHENDGGVYEVLRVIQGVPLFVEDHLERFFMSANLAGIKIKYSENEIKQFLHTLILANKIKNGNILISCKENLKGFFIAHQYPEQEMYETGVVCGLLNAERTNPNAKVFQTMVRRMADEAMTKNGYYEVLLVDKEGRITEGSRSNVFFVVDDKVKTPPGNDVLLGITRNKAILLAKKLGYQLEEEEIKISDLEIFDAAFISGTSPKFLPIKKIGDVGFDVENKVVKHLISAYNEMIAEYVKKQSGFL